MAGGGRATDPPAPDRPPSRASLVRRALLDFLFPPRCVACGQRGAWLCQGCRPTLTLYQPPLCPRCGLPLLGAPCPGCAPGRLAVSARRVAGPFSGPLRQAVHRLKFSGERYLAEPLGDLLAQAWRQAPLAGDCLVPVPLHARQLAARGYNQSHLLAAVAAPQLGLPLLIDGLHKLRETPPQVGLHEAERRRNLAGAFAWQGSAPSHPVLVDDVTTTGATLGACAAALRAAGASRVYALVLARAE